MKTGLNRRQMREAIAAREDCVNSTGSLRGVVLVHPYVDPGRLNSEEKSRLNLDLPNITYVVFSYSTPIAWELKDGSKYRVVQKFSPTTSQHMGLTWRGDNENA